VRCRPLLVPLRGRPATQRNQSRPQVKPTNCLGDNYQRVQQLAVVSAALDWRVLSLTAKRYREVCRARSLTGRVTTPLVVGSIRAAVGTVLRKGDLILG
jgi:hypothetical protein